jgi:hypothetical protein
MRAGFKDVVLEVILVEQHEAALVATVGELPKARPIPRVEFREIVLLRPSQAAPCVSGGG